ncbi:MAG TPA: hypothetical protein VGH28_01795 [Polyangiaceae bacterium]
MSAARALACAIAVATCGCVLLVDSAPSDQFSTTCSIANADTTCGACLAQTCSNALDACCANADCAAHLSDVDSCAGGDCSALEQDSASAFRPMVDCALDSCASACSFTLPTTTTCTPSQSPALCSCDIPQGPAGNTTACHPTAAGICCASAGWPQTTTTCACDLVGCTSSADSCTCGYALPTTTTTCTGLYCCKLSDGTCTCSDAAYVCDGATMVDSCSAADVTCDERETRVPRCSAD